MPRRFAPPLAALFFILSVTRCSLTTDLDGLSGGAYPADAAEGAPHDEAGADAKSDAGAPEDSGVDADGGRFCAPFAGTSTFCDDFDDTGPLTRWTETVLNAGGTVARDTSASRSAPSSLLSTTPASTQKGSAAIRLLSSTTVQRVRVAYDMRIDARDPQTGYVEASYLRAPTYALYFRLYKDVTQPAVFTAEAYLPDGGVPAHNTDLVGVVFTDWTHVEVVLDLGASPHATVTVNGTLAADVPLEPELYAPAPISVAAGIGYSAAPSSSAWAVRYDDVTIDFTP